MKDNKTVGFPPLTGQQRDRLERRFTLDCVAVASLSDVSRNRTNPGIQVTLPLYNPQKDEGCVSYFKYKGIKKVLKRTQQDNTGTSQYGKVLDSYITTCDAIKYLKKRNTNGSGYGADEVSGHYSSPVYRRKVPMMSYNGAFGYRRNTPTLRHFPSSFEPPVNAAFHPNGSYKSF